MARPNVILPSTHTPNIFGGPKVQGARMPSVPQINKPKGVPPTATSYAYSRQLAEQAAMDNGIDPQEFVKQLSYVSGLNRSARGKGWGIAGLDAAGIKNVNPWDPQQSLGYAAKVMAGLQLLRNTRSGAGY